MKIKIRVIIIGALVGAVLSAVAQTTLVQDSFDVPEGTWQAFDLQTNQVARQAGGTVSVTYANASVALAAVTQVYLSQTEDDRIGNGTGVLVMRNLPTSDGGTSIGAASAVINEDLSASLAGNRYAISYSGVMSDRTGSVINNPTNVTSWYHSISLGGGSGHPGEPNAALADLGFRILHDGTAEVFADGLLRGSKAVSGITNNIPFDVLLEIDEVLLTASVSVDVGGTVTDVGTFGFAYDEGETARRLQFYTRIRTVGLPDNPAGVDAIIDGHVDDLAITVLPSSLNLMTNGAFEVDSESREFPGYGAISGWTQSTVSRGLNGGSTGQTPFGPTVDNNGSIYAFLQNTGIIAQQGLSWTPGQEYVVSVDVAVRNGNDANFDVRVLDDTSGSPVLLDELGNTQFSSGGGFTNYTFTFTPGDGQTGGELQLVNDNASGTILFDNVSIVAAPFEDLPSNVVNLIPNGDFAQTTNASKVNPAGYNLLGTYGDFVAFTGATIEVVGWLPYYNDPSNLTAMVGNPHVIDGVGDLDGTFYLDTLFRSDEVMVLNSSTHYQNGVVQSNILGGATIKASASYTFAVDVVQNGATDNASTTFTAALTAGADSTNVANAVSGSLIQVAVATLPFGAGTPQVTTVSGADLMAAEAAGGLNVLFGAINTEVVDGFPVITSNTVASLDYVSQTAIESITLTLVSPFGDLNGDGVVDPDDEALVQLYLDGNGGVSAAVRQSELIAAGYTPAGALAYLNLTAFDLNGDDTFDSADVAVISDQFEELVFSVISEGGALSFSWRSFGSKQYDLESSVSLTSPGWVAYDDGSTVYENIPGSETGSNTISGVQNSDPVRFFKVIEK